MKDRTKAKSPSSVNNAVNIVELTPEMALPDQSRYKIVNLTRTIDDQASITADKPVPPKLVQEVEPSQKEATLPPTDKPLAQKKKEETAAPRPDETVAFVEKEVDAAFDNVQTLVKDAHQSEDHKLLDELSDLTEQVDHAVQKKSETKLPPKKEPASNEPPDPLPDIDEEKLAADAAALDAALSAEHELGDAFEEADVVDEDESAVAGGSLELGSMDEDSTVEEAIELTDIVDPDELDDEVLELTDIVDPNELDDEVIELTDIVDPTELENAAGPDAEDDIIELTDIVDPNELKAGSDAQSDEEIIELTDILGRDKSAEGDKNASHSEEDDQLIQLSDVLSQKTKSGPPPSPSEGADDENDTATSGSDGDGHPPE